MFELRAAIVYCDLFALFKPFSNPSYILRRVGVSYISTKLSLDGTKTNLANYFSYSFATDPKLLSDLAYAQIPPQLLRG